MAPSRSACAPERRRRQLNGQWASGVVGLESGGALVRFLCGGSRIRAVVLVQFFDRRQTKPLSTSPYAVSTGFMPAGSLSPWAGDLRCVELSFFDFVRQLDSAQCYFRIPDALRSSDNISAPTSGDPVQSYYSSTCWSGRAFERARRPRPSIRRRRVRRPTAVDDLLRGLVITNRF